jgi:hypothetical protein
MIAFFLIAAMLQSPNCDPRIGRRAWVRLHTHQAAA